MIRLCLPSLVWHVLAGGALYDGRGTYNDVIGYAERLFSRIRQTVSTAAVGGEALHAWQLQSAPLHRRPAVNSGTIFG